jgi:hypothetical protein
MYFDFDLPEATSAGLSVVSESLQARERSDLLLQTHRGSNFVLVHGKHEHLLLGLSLRLGTAQANSECKNQE